MTDFHFLNTRNIVNSFIYLTVVSKTNRDNKIKKKIIKGYNKAIKLDTKL